MKVMKGTRNNIVQLIQAWASGCRSTRDPAMPHPPLRIDAEVSPLSEPEILLQEPWDRRTNYRRRDIFDHFLQELMIVDADFFGTQGNLGKHMRVLVLIRKNTKTLQQQVTHLRLLFLHQPFF